jgi:DNA-binding MarR family transcriptional regulator
MAGRSDPTRPDTGELAVALAMAVKRLRARMREEAGANASGLTLTQLAIVERLLTEGSMSASQLAAAEHVSQQAIAQALPALKQAGLVHASPDPLDGRKRMITATAAARRFRARLRQHRELWLIRALEGGLSGRERARLAEAVDLLERLAAVDLSSEYELR